MRGFFWIKLKIIVMNKRNEVYNEIGPCGNLSYKGLSLLINNLVFQSPADQLFLIKSIGINGKFSKTLWEFLIRTCTFIEDPKINRVMALEILRTQNCFKRFQLIEILESIEFINGVPPTFLMDGDFILIDA